MPRAAPRRAARVVPPLRLPRSPLPRLVRRSRNGGGTAPSAWTGSCATSNRVRAKVARQPLVARVVRPARRPTSRSMPASPRSSPSSPFVRSSHARTTPTLRRWDALLTCRHPLLPLCLLACSLADLYISVFDLPLSEYGLAYLLCLAISIVGLTFAYNALTEAHYARYGFQSGQAPLACSLLVCALLTFCCW